MKELKPDKYRNLKQTVVVKNIIDAVTGRLMINELTDASLCASYDQPNTPDDNSTYDDHTRQYCSRQDMINKWHTLADSLVAVRMKTITHHFSLSTPIAGNYSAKITLSGTEYKVANGDITWDEVIGHTSSALSAQSFIKNNSQVTTSTWTTNSACVNFGSGKVNMFAFFKDIKTVNWTNAYVGPNDSYYRDNLISSDWILTQWIGNKDWYPENDPNKNLDTSYCQMRNSPSIWYINNGGSDEMIYTPCVLPNPYKVFTRQGIWENQPFYIAVALDTPAPSRPTVYENGKVYSDMQETMIAQSCPIKTRYKEMQVKVTKTDVLGYEFDVEVTFPEKYVYIAGARGCNEGFFYNLKEWSLIDSLGFVDYITNVHIELFGEVFDESTEEFSYGDGNNIKRLDNNELLTKNASVSGVLAGTIAWRAVKHDEDGGFIGDDAWDSVNENTGEYQFRAEWHISKSRKTLYEQMKRAYEINNMEIKVHSNDMWSTGDIYDVQLEFDETTHAYDYIIYIKVKGVSSQVFEGAEYWVDVYTYAEDSYTGSWKYFAYKLLTSAYGKGRSVINVEVDATYIMGNGGIKINDWLKFKNIHNEWITRNHIVSYFTVKNIRKKYENEHYTYILTCIESGYGEQTVDSIKLFAYSEYDVLPLDWSHGRYLSMGPARPNENAPIFNYYSLGNNLVVSDIYDVGGIMTFEFDYHQQNNILQMSNLETSIRVSEGDVIFLTDQAEFHIYTDRETAVVMVPYIKTVPSATMPFLTTQDIKSFRLLLEVLPDDITHENKYLREVSDELNTSAYGFAITNKDISGLDAGYIKLDDYDELNDCIVFVVRFPLWLIRYQADEEFTLYKQISNVVGDAGYIKRYDTVEKHAIMQGTRGHPDSGTNQLLFDKDYEYLVDKHNSPLIVSEEHPVCYTGLYAIGVITPTNSELEEGIVPYLRGAYLSNNELLKRVSYGQAQYYHVKGRNFTNLDTLWKLLIDSGELNNYFDKVYLYPYPFEKQVNWKAYNKDNGMYKSDEDIPLADDEHGYKLNAYSISGLAGTAYCDTNNEVTKVRVKNYYPAANPTIFDSAFSIGRRTITRTGIAVDTSVTPSEGRVTIYFSLENGETFCPMFLRPNITITSGPGTVVHAEWNYYRDSNGSINQVQVYFIVNGGTTSTRCKVEITFCPTIEVEVTNTVEGKMSQYKEKTFTVSPGNTYTIRADNSNIPWNMYYPSRVSDVSVIVRVSFDNGVTWDEFDGQWENYIYEDDARFIVKWGTGVKYATYSGSVLIAPEILVKPLKIQNGTDGTVNSTVICVKDNQN